MSPITGVFNVRLVLHSDPQPPRFHEQNWRASVLQNTLYTCGLQHKISWPQYDLEKTDSVPGQTVQATAANIHLDETARPDPLIHVRAQYSMILRWPHHIDN